MSTGDASPGARDPAVAGPAESNEAVTAARVPLRSIDIGSYHDAFLVSAVVVIITIRLQLWATGYPALGGGNLHIAHLLWGGLFMVIAILFSISFIGRRPVLPAAIIGGVGFAFFIDEVGKFVTKDNDYFFQPTATIIYIVFLVLYFALRQVRVARGFSRSEHLHNAMELLGGGADGHLTEVDRQRALSELDLAGDHPMVPTLRAAADAAPTAVIDKQLLPVRVAAAVRGFYFRQAARPGFPRFVSIVFGLWTFLNVVSVIVFLFAGLDIGKVAKGFGDDSFSHLNFANWCTLISTMVCVGLAVNGFRHMRHDGDLVAAYTWFDRALLVNIFITHIFLFAESSFSATTGFVIAVLLLFAIRYMLAREIRRGYDEPEAIETRPPDLADPPATVSPRPA